MLNELQGDAVAFMNYCQNAHDTERNRLMELIGDETKTNQLLEFGIRPFGRMDIDPYNQPADWNKPWEPRSEDLSDEPLVVDIQTGWVFHVEPKNSSFRLDVTRSNNFMEAQELLDRASHRPSKFSFLQKRIPALHHLDADSDLSFPVTQPLHLQANSKEHLHRLCEELQNLFCGKLPVKKLWFRGQRTEYSLNRDKLISKDLYGQDFPSLAPSLARYSFNNPNAMNFGFVYGGPNHYWKKPFLIWLLRENYHWFGDDNRFAFVMQRVLEDPDDMTFSKLLNQIQLSPIETGDPPFLNWPDEADDLRQWFFAYMKRRQLAVVLQQYGYHTSILDITDDLDVALYFAQSSMTRQGIKKSAPEENRIIYIFAQSDGDFYNDGRELFWGDDGWIAKAPPRLQCQKAGFLMGATSRCINFYGTMIIAKIHLDLNVEGSRFEDSDLFPSDKDDLLFQTLKQSKPAPEGLY